MKTIFHDKESGTKLQMEGTFAESEAQLVDDEGNVLIEFEGSYPEILEAVGKLSYEDKQDKKEPKRYEESLTNSDFRNAKVKVLEDIEDEYGDIVKKGTITGDVTVLSGEDLYIEDVFVRPKDFKKLEILTDEQEDIQVGDYVKVKEGKEYSGAKGFAIVAEIEEDKVRLKGINIHGDYSETWINNVSNVIKIG